MARMPAKMYRRITQQAYTRRKYIGGVPGLRITQFELGHKQGEFPATLHLTAREACQIRHTALEAARISANRVVAKRCGSLGYHLKIRVYPHHVLRHNKQAAGAGADRISSGMRGAFGKPVGTAARVDVGQELVTIRTHWQFLDAAQEALRKASMKLPTPCDVVIVGEVPKNIDELKRSAKAIGVVVEEEPPEPEEPEVPEGEQPEGEEGEGGEEAEEGEAKKEEGGREGKRERRSKDE